MNFKKNINGQIETATKNAKEAIDSDTSEAEAEKDALKKQIETNETEAKKEFEQKIETAKTNLEKAIKQQHDFVSGLGTLHYSSIGLQAIIKEIADELNNARSTGVTGSVTSSADITKMTIHNADDFSEVLKHPKLVEAFKSRGITPNPDHSITFSYNPIHHYLAPVATWRTFIESYKLLNYDQENNDKLRISIDNGYGQEKSARAAIQAAVECGYDIDKITISTANPKKKCTGQDDIAKKFFEGKESKLQSMLGKASQRKQIIDKDLKEKEASTPASGKITDLFKRHVQEIKQDYQGFSPGRAQENQDFDHISSRSLS